MDKLGNVITDESNPAYLAGALVNAKAALQWMPAVKRFLEERTLVVGHRTVAGSIGEGAGNRWLVRARTRLTAPGGAVGLRRSHPRWGCRVWRLTADESPWRRRGEGGSDRR